MDASHAIKMSEAKKDLARFLMEFTEKHNLSHTEVMELLSEEITSMSRSLNISNR